MTRRLKLMSGLSTLAAAGALALSGCGGDKGADESAEPATGHNGHAAAPEEAPDAAAPAPAAGMEGEGATAADPAESDVAFMHLLGLVRGHLIACHELYKSGARDMALMHVKHPESELYASLQPAFDARGLPGFADELNALAEAANAGGDIDAPYSAVVEAIAANTPAMSVAERLVAISEIMRTAADEFDIGVDDGGAIVNAHEYQDAYGFLIASRDILAGIETSDVNESDAIALAHEQLETALAPYNGLTEASTEGRPSTLYGAAARIEIAGRGLM